MASAKPKCQGKYTSGANKGKRCTAPAINGGYCGRHGKSKNQKSKHDDSDDDGDDVVICRATVKTTGAACKNPAIKDGYCGVHRAQAGKVSKAEAKSKPNAKAKAKVKAKASVNSKSKSDDDDDDDDFAADDEPVCMAIKNTGELCMYRALAGTSYCGVHKAASKVDPTKALIDALLDADEVNDRDRVNDILERLQDLKGRGGSVRASAK